MTQCKISPALVAEDGTTRVDRALEDPWGVQAAGGPQVPLTYRLRRPGRFVSTTWAFPIARDNDSENQQAWPQALLPPTYPDAEN